MKMGYKEGEGLGSKNQGRTTNLDPYQKYNRGGIGADDKLPSNFKKQNHEEDQTDYPYEQKIEYISCKSPISDTKNAYKPTTSNENENNVSEYCDKNLVDVLMKLKSEFDGLDSRKFTDSRFRTNPYERLGKSIFQNRAALKMANIDKVTKISEIEKISEEKQILYFADICAGPGISLK
jgi:cap1 methyltransferase